MKRAGHTVWMNLGAIQSKCEHVAETLLTPDVARKLHVLFLAKGVQATTAIEGNTLSESQVRDRIKSRKTLPPSQEYQGQEVDNIVRACNLIGERILGDADCLLTVAGIKEFNALALNKRPLDDGVVPGEISKHEVVVARYRGAPREDCEYLLEQLCEWINGIVPPDESQRIAFGVLRAVMAHLYLAWIHPFGDGNGRTARLVEFQILLGAGVPSIAAHLLSNHYNLTRTNYYLELDKASKSGGDVLPFLAYAIQGFKDGLDEQIHKIGVYLWRMTWKEHVYNLFEGKNSTAARRQRAVALTLGMRPWRLISVANIPTLDAEIAKSYASKSSKMVSRDLNELEQMGLLVRKGTAVRAKREVLQSLLPKRRQNAIRK
jgi:Fic family protein